MLLLLNLEWITQLWLTLVAENMNSTLNHVSCLSLG